MASTDLCMVNLTSHKSDGLSKGISEEMVKIIEKISPDRNINIDRFNYYLRKTARFFSYIVLV